MPLFLPFKIKEIRTALPSRRSSEKAKLPEARLVRRKTRTDPPSILAETGILENEESGRRFKKCPRPDLNWHRDLIPQRILSPVRLPIPPLGHFTRRQITERRMEARGGIEPPISVLQTDALPLCYRAKINNVQELKKRSLTEKPTSLDRHKI